MKKRKEIELIRRAQVAMQKSNAELIRQNQKFRESLRLIHGMAYEGLRTEDGGNRYWSIEAEAAAALELSAKQRDIGLPEVPEPCVTIGEMECDLLNMLVARDARYLSICLSGYMLAMLKLKSCEFVHEYAESGIAWITITDKGRAYHAQKVERA
jgi:hypothetical protein